MNPDIHPARQSGHDRYWRRSKPVFSLLAFLLAIAVGAGTFAFIFKREWTPLQRVYFRTFIETLHFTRTRNPYLRPIHSFWVLVIKYPHGARLATAGDVESTYLRAGVPHGVLAFRLTSAALRNHARRLSWQHLRLDDNWLHAWLRQWIYGGRSLWQLIRSAWYAFLLALAVLMPLAVRKDISVDRRRRRGRPLKGANLITRAEFHKRYRRLAGMGWLTSDQPSFWERANLDKHERNVVRVSRRSEWEHFLLIGATGSGKSSLIRQMLIQIVRRGETAIVYDPAREYLPQFLDPDRGDIVLNPLDARMPQWSPSDELIHHSEADTIAKSFYPDRDHENRFFVESPRKIFAYLLKFHPTPHELCDWIARADPEIDARVVGTALEPIISKTAPQQRSGVLSGLEKVSNSFSLLPVLTDRRRAWTATRWAGGRRGWIFLTSTVATREALRPLLTLWLDLLILRLASQTDYGQRPVWVILDELASLETLPTLPFALSEGRKSNVRMVLGLQGRSQVEAIYGREAEAMLSQPRTRIFLRTTEPRAAEWVSKCIGDVEIEHLREGWSKGEWGLRQTDNVNIDRRIEAAILASEIANLQDLEGFVQGPGFTLKARFPLFPPEKKSPDLIWRPAADPTPPPRFKHYVRVSDPAEPEEDSEPEAPTESAKVSPGKWKAQEAKVEEGDTHPAIGAS